VQKRKRSRHPHRNSVPYWPSQLIAHDEFLVGVCPSLLRPVL
jgi:hypothetical protein